MPGVEARPYRPEDRAAVCRICYDCGLMGESMHPIIGSQRLFTDYWMTYYLEHEPESTWVITVEDEPVGYLVGCTDTRRFEEVQQEEIWPWIVRRFVTGTYGLPRPLLSFIWRLLWTQAKDRILRAPLDRYPAHLHMNVAAGHRQRGHGSLLMDAYLAQLQECGVPGVHLVTTTRNTLAVPFYERRGFVLEDRAPVSLYKSYLKETVDGLLYVRNLEAASAD